MIDDAAWLRVADCLIAKRMARGFLLEDTDTQQLRKEIAEAGRSARATKDGDAILAIEEVMLVAEGLV